MRWRDATSGRKGLTSNASPGDAVWGAGAVLGALGSVVGVGNDLVRVRLEADKAVGVLECVRGCKKHSQTLGMYKNPWNVAPTFCSGSVSCTGQGHILHHGQTIMQPII